MKGTLRANTYYYEEGNIQFNLDTKFDGSAEGGDDAEVAANLVEFIVKTVFN